MLQLNRLEGFYWVAKFEGYARAARNFPYPISQPGVYQQVKKLEDELGCTLFRRVGKDRVAPTAAGQLLYDFCAPFFERLPAIERTIRAQSYGGTLRVDSSTLVVRSLLPDWLRRLRQQHSDIEVSLQEVDEPSFTRLQNGKADLLIDWIDPRPPWTVSTTVAIAFSHLVWPAAWGRKLARTGGPRPEDFLGQPFVAYPRDWAQHGLQQAGLSRLGLTATRELYAKSADSILSFVQAGLGYSLVPWLDQRGPKLPQLCSWRVDEPDATFPIYAIHSQAAAQNPLIDAMLATAPDYPPASTR